MGTETAQASGDMLPSLEQVEASSDILRLELLSPESQLLTDCLRRSFLCSVVWVCLSTTFFEAPAEHKPSGDSDDADDCVLQDAINMART